MSQIALKEPEEQPSQAPEFPPFDPMAPALIKNPLLEDVPAEAIKRGWFTMAHLVLENGSKVLDIQCGNGLNTYVMAALNPKIEIIGIDRDVSLIEKAEKKYQLPNLKFMSGDIQENFVPKGSLDATVNSFILHEIYSENNCSEKAVIESLERQFELLKPNGLTFFQGHIIPSDSDYVLIEIPEDPSKSDKIELLNDIELLQLYAEQARPFDEEYGGFYMEELPARFPRTRLFRLPAKWAHEFILRKENRNEWDNEIHKEYTFFTRSEFSRILKNYGARILYSAPHWDETIIKKSLHKKIRLFDETGEPKGTPETSFVFVAQKMPEKSSLTIEERKPSKKENPALRMIAMRNEYDGSTLDVVSRDIHITEILPFRVTQDNSLHVYVHEGIPRCLANTVQRKGSNIDGKQWSGHMIEALSIPQEVFETLNEKHFRSTLKFSQDYLGLKPKIGSLFEDGPGFYPAPDTIDEHIETKYINIEKPDETITPRIVMEDIEGFSTKGRIREIDAQQILNAVGVGLIPTSRLEIQILALYEKLGLSYQSWADCPLTLKTEEPDKTTKLQDIIANLAKEDHRFKETKALAGQLKPMQSIFVDEGQDQGGVKGLASRDKDFVLQEDGSMNTAIILPLTRKINGEVMAGIVEQYLPVPQRYKGNGYTVNCPSFTIPPEIKNFDMAKRFIADKFEVPVECVSRMGESYFSHIGLTPQRIYPFAVCTAGAKGWKKVGRTHGATTYSPLYRLYRLLYLDNYYSFMKVVAMAYQASMGYDSDLSIGTHFEQKHADRKDSFVGMSVNYSSGSSSSNDYSND
jgi:SAM-dependent methyltransferase